MNNILAMYGGPDLYANGNEICFYSRDCSLMFIGQLNMMKSGYQRPGNGWVMWI